MGQWVMRSMGQWVIRSMGYEVGSSEEFDAMTLTTCGVVLKVKRVMM